ncbi:uncharacterized protein A4U43_C08F33530 [Asparagus officinalis]|nr:uncharacterized protein A4U43_C08F33530 [Asparagus officinalis]
MAPIRRQKELNYQIGEVTAFGHSDRILEGTMDSNNERFKQNVSHLSVGYNCSIASSNSSLGVARTCFDEPLVIGDVENSTSLGTSSSYSLKDARQLQIAYSSMNACSSSPVEESEAMRKWKEIKQNGFLTHPNGGVPMPEPQHGKRSKRRNRGIDQKRKMELIKAEEDYTKMEIVKVKQCNREMETENRGKDCLKMKIENGGQENRRIETAKGEQDKMLKNAPSSGLLSQISTGIIRRVKNYEEVHAILEEIVCLNKPDRQRKNESVNTGESGV